MPLPLIPLIIGGAAALAGAGGVGAGIHGAVKMKDAKNTMESADRRHRRNVSRFEEQNETTTFTMDELGKTELEILKSFSKFTEVFEKIHNKPEFEKISKDGVHLPSYTAEELKRTSVGAGVLLGGLGGAAVGTAGGFAAAGATTAAVMALGTASTGTAIASLSGVAATNATLAALGGGALAAGGGGMALGSAVLGGATLGVGLLVGGVIFSITGKKLSDKADEAWAQMLQAEEEIDKICDYLVELDSVASQYFLTMTSIQESYVKQLSNLTTLVTVSNRRDWNMYTNEEKLLVENTALLVKLLYAMCKVQLVKKSGEVDLNRINYSEIDNVLNEANPILEGNDSLLIEEDRCTCLSCGATYKPNAKFCSRCGTKI
ncbi:MAG: zinc ribbon domain-containing protein [Spirochaetaceae bacterium]|nr:zinc ribbon domain-containing protein [Spirochaetaceae bacterium]